MTSFSFFKYFDAFELDVNVVNFVYYGKTRFKVAPLECNGEVDGTCKRSLKARANAKESKNFLWCLKCFL